MVILLLSLWACDDGAVCPEVPMNEGPGGLLVLEDEHATGWGEADCTQCHAIDVLHDRGCTPWVDPAALVETVDEAFAADGADACVTCHGTNGVTP